MEDSYSIAPSEIQGLQPTKDEQTAWKDRSSPPRTILPSAILHPRCRHGGGLSGPVLYFPSPIFLIAALWIRRSLRKSLKRREFELDRKVAEQLGIPQPLQVLEKILNLDRIRIPTNLRFPILVGWIAYWTPSIRERTGDLS